MQDFQLRKAFCSIAFFFLSAEAAYSQGQVLAPIELPQAAPIIPSLTPVDITPVNTNREQQLLRPGATYYLFQNLPSRLWFNLTTETSQRYETNVFFSRTRYVSDYVYRILPNITLGYETFKKVSIYCNYFTIKDVFVGHHQLTFPTTQSLSMGFRRDFAVTPLTNLQLDFQSRELWQTTGLHQADLIPATTITRFLTPHAIVYLNLMLQMRGRYYYVAPTREIDPFYTLGALYTKGSWMFSAVGTLVTNFRHPPFNDAVPNQSNNSIICDFEVSHPIPKLSHLVCFVRAEPIFNWNGNGVQGISGMDFRLFSGVRLSLAKPTYTASIKQLKQQLRDINVNQAEPSTGTPEPSTQNNQPNSNTNQVDTNQKDPASGPPRKDNRPGANTYEIDPASGLPEPAADEIPRPKTKQNSPASSDINEPPARENQPDPNSKEIIPDSPMLEPSTQNNQSDSNIKEKEIDSASNTIGSPVNEIQSDNTFTQIDEASSTTEPSSKENRPEFPLETPTSPLGQLAPNS